MEFTQLLIIVFGMALVTAVPRIVPLGFLAGRPMPIWFEVWLKYVPISILSAMLIVDVVWRENELDLSPATNLMMHATLIAFLIAWYTRSLFATVAGGVIVLALLRHFS
ncbi:MAG TPA: AzlD domain-containing protein [Bdellovibrionota bacterium]|nr:AzlD domain-containing protein [Bdellovibrionota bacterium]